MDNTVVKAIVVTPQKIHLHSPRNVCMQYENNLANTMREIVRKLMLTITLMTSQGSDTVTSIFKCNSSNTTTSLRLLKMAQFA